MSKHYGNLYQNAVFPIKGNGNVDVYI